MSTTDTTLLQSKKHFEILDGLRGVAALAVVCFHFMEIAYLPDRNFIAHGFLAVDFFFCLSGFVIAYSYDDRLSKIGIKEFFKSRLIRLHPLVVLGTVLGLIAFLFDPFATQSVGYSGGQMVWIVLASLFMVPHAVISERFFNLFGLNAPSWSLFWEYVANIVYALILVRLPRIALIIALFIAAVLLWQVSLRAGDLIGGWNGETFWDGGARVFYSFTAGMLIHRYKLIFKNKLGFAGLAVLLMLAFIMPYHSEWNWLTQPLVVMLYFPLLVSLGAGTMLNAGTSKLCSFLGDISYPLYMTHYFVMFSFLNYYNASKPSTSELVLIVVGGMLILVLFAYTIMVVYDKPVRRYLNKLRGTR